MTGGAETAVVRSAGLPIRMWLAAAAAPDVLILVRRLEATDEDHRLACALLAGTLGTQLVPSEQLSTAERRQVLAARRRLHHGVPLSNDEYRQLDKLSVRAGVAGTSVGAGAGGLAAQLARAERLAADLALFSDRAAAAIEAENARLLAAPWELLRSSAVGRQMLADPSLAPAADIAERLARGEPWTSKRMRRRSEYLWRMIARGTTKSTPRGWLGQVGLTELRDTDTGTGTGGDQDPLTLTAAAAVEWTQNVHASRAGALAPALDAETRLSLAPLQSAEPGDHLRILALTPDASRLRTWRIRRSAALETVIGELRTGPVRVRDLSERAFGPAGSDQRAAMDAFVSRLAEMGVLQADAMPERTSQRWRPIEVLSAPRSAAGFLDVYRESTGAATAIPGLQHAIEQVQRLRALMQADTPPAPNWYLDRLSPDPRPVLDVFTELLAAQTENSPAQAEQEKQHEQHQHGAWPRARDAGSGYSRLLEAIAAQVSAAPVGAAPVGAAGGGSDGTADITPAMLDAADAPSGRITWPVDVTVRTSGSGPCVLDDTAPAAVLDARFVEMLEWLHGPVPHAVAYREFLAELDRRSGIRSVELLIPPAEEWAANAVRRPRYVGAWTGDSDPASYGFSQRTGRTAPEPAAEFVPLGALTVQRDGDRILVAAGGQPVRILFHATRAPRGPWRLLVSLLQDSRQRALRTCPLRCSLPAFDGRDWLPRITVAGTLVISPAQWRIGAGELWDPGAPELAKVRALVRLGERRALPRWVFVSAQPGAKTIACDLESLRALPLLEQAAEAGRPGLVIEEMLPAPPGCGVPELSGEPGDRVAAELMIRLPAAASMSCLAVPFPPGADRAGDLRLAEEGR